MGVDGGELLEGRSLYYGWLTKRSLQDSGGSVTTFVLSSLADGCTLHLEAVMLALILAASLSTPVQVDKVSVVKPALVYGLAGVADVLSTQYVLSRGGVERNPLWRNSSMGQLTAYKLGMVAAQTAAVVYLQKKGHKGWARGMRIGSAVLFGAVTVHNIRQGRK